MMSSFTPFSIARLPRIEFGCGSFSKVPDIVSALGKKVLVVTGRHSFQSGDQWPTLLAAFERLNIDWQQCSVEGEPSPQYVDERVSEFSGQDIDVVLGIGGGSVLDAAKAIAGLLKIKRTVLDYLEGVGPELAYEGPSVPFVAVPTTAGTGSETTRNAVLSVQGIKGFKKSFRDEKLVAEYAVVDPELLASCTPELIAANGMDALTQLMESYVSLRANVMIDALALSGLQAVRDGLINWYQGSNNVETARQRMAYAAMTSGITLAQVGLGSVHGLASPLGAFYPIPHGVVCGTLVAAATEININSMLSREPDNVALDKYAHLGEVLCQQQFSSRENAWQALVDLLKSWTEQMKLPRLASYGLNAEGLDQVVAHSRGSSMKTNPIVLTDAEIKQALEMRL